MPSHVDCRACALALTILLQAAATRAQVSGTVRDAATRDPIAGAMITWQAQDVRTIADQSGLFTLQVPPLADIKIVGAAKGYFNQPLIVNSPATGLILTLTPVPQDDDPTYNLMSPETCALCHPNQYNEWIGSPMNQAGINTWVDDLYSGLGTPGGHGGFVYTRDSIFAATNPNSECASCHQPERWIQSPFTALADPKSPRTPDVLHGISCEVCHKVADVDTTKINFPGIFPGAVTFTRPAGPTYHPVQFGLLGDADFQQPGLMRASYQPQLAAEVCAACHQDANDPEENHTYSGPISEPTYLEWLDSPYSEPSSPAYASCVDCHMPPAGYDKVCELLFPPLLRDPQTIRSHRIEGTTPEFLENAAELNLTITRDGPLIRATAEVANTATGHHLPTGVTVRNMILLIEALRAADQRPLPVASDQVIHELGGVGNPAQGYYAGLPGKLFAKLIRDYDGHAPTFFTDAEAIVFDNRIPAFETDVSEYAFVAPGDGGDVQVRARLIYRRSFRALLDAKQWTTDGHGNPLADLEPPHFGHLMELAEQSVGTYPADADGDDDTDLDDFIRWSSCASFGPDRAPEDVTCLVFDQNRDGDVDLRDFHGFQASMRQP